jgi:hypothetical protein
MLDIATATHDIERWIETFVEIPHPSLGGWSPCPYARKARLDRDFEIRVGRNPFEDLIAISYSTVSKSVTIFVYDPEFHPYDQFHQEIEYANTHYLVPRDMIALEDHPADAEIVNGVSMNQGTYALALVQCLSDLDQKAQSMARKGFYDTWPEDYLQTLFAHRKDPRS